MKHGNKKHYETNHPEFDGKAYTNAIYRYLLADAGVDYLIVNEPPRAGEGEDE